MGLWNMILFIILNTIMKKYDMQKFVRVSSVRILILLLSITF